MPLLRRLHLKARSPDAAIAAKTVPLFAATDTRWRGVLIGRIWDGELREWCGPVRLGVATGRTTSAGLTLDILGRRV
jgi:hypothetical protein